jgi:hypothetical protein
MNYKRLLNTKVGIIFISIMLGLGLAVLFRSACNGKDCLDFRGPSFSDVNGKTYQFGDSCYKYNAVTGECDSRKQQLNFSNKMHEGLDPTASVPPSTSSVSTGGIIATNGVVSTSGPAGTSGPIITPTATPLTLKKVWDLTNYYTLLYTLR